MRQITFVWVIIVLALASIANYPKQVQAQITEPDNRISESLQLDNFQEPPPPPDAPEGRRRGTGSRGD